MTQEIFDLLTAIMQKFGYKQKGKTAKYIKGDKIIYAPKSCYGGYKNRLEEKPSSISPYTLQEEWGEDLYNLSINILSEYKEITIEERQLALEKIVEVMDRLIQEKTQ